MIHAPNLSLIGQASPVIQLHLAAALLALGLGAVILSSRRGTPRHKQLGWAWVALMLVVAVSSFFIRAIFPGHFSPIHLLSLLTLASLPFAIWRIKSRDFKGHERTMLGLYFTGLVIAGLFTFFPGRLMWRVFFG